MTLDAKFPPRVASRIAPAAFFRGSPTEGPGRPGNQAEAILGPFPAILRGRGGRPERPLPLGGSEVSAVTPRFYWGFRNCGPELKNCSKGVADRRYLGHTWFIKRIGGRRVGVNGTERRGGPSGLETAPHHEERPQGPHRGRSAGVPSSSLLPTSERRSHRASGRVSAGRSPTTLGKAPPQTSTVCPYPSPQVQLT